MKFLIDTNICIHILRGDYCLNEKIKSANHNNCFISEITYLELRYGAVRSNKEVKNLQRIKYFFGGLNVISISNSLNEFCTQKARLRKQGNLIPDFDLLIGATAIHENLTQVTQNTKDFIRLDGIKLEDWTKTN